MSGNTANAAVWGGADVLIAPITATIPTTNAAFPIHRTATVGTTSGSATVTGTTFAASDVGQSISGTGIPVGATITAVSAGVNATISANATATGSPTATIGATTGWTYVGLLDGGQGFEEGIEVESTEHDAWGYGVIATTYKAQKTTKTFTSLEENATVMGLVYDVSSMTFDDTAGTYVGTLKVRDHTEQIRIAFVTTSGTNEKRMISKNYATVAPTNAGSDGEESLGSKGFTATIYANGSSELWYAYKGASL
jgi:hypothetical protein